MFWELGGFFSHGLMEFMMDKLRILWKHNWLSAFAGLLLLLRGTALPCPPACLFCSADRAECEQVSSLQAVLIGLPNYTEKIVLRYGNLSEIPPLSFHKFPNLHFLSITGFPVSSLTHLTFSPAQANSLRNLDLSSNHLLSCSIESMAFSGLVTLEELTLNNNSLDILQSPWFLGLTALSKLSLALNRIAYLPPRMFENLTRLEVLVVSSNEIQYLSMDTFYGLASLTRLDLSKNKIVFINDQVFQPLQSLRYLLLSDNKLTALPDLPSSITALFLHANPWECSCQLVVSLESWMDRIQESALVVCNTPPNLAGRQVTSARLEGCSSTSDPNLPTQTSLNLSLLLGLLGGVFIGLVECLIFCCCLKFCKGQSAKEQRESEKSFLGKFANTFSEKQPAASADPQFLGGFPVIENTTIGFEVGSLGKRTCDGLREASRTYSMEEAKSIVKRPLVALLSIDKATNKTVVTLREQGRKNAGLNLNQWQAREEQIHSPNPTPRFLGTPEQQGLVHDAHKFCGSPFQQLRHPAMPGEFLWTLEIKTGGGEEAPLLPIPVIILEVETKEKHCPVFPLVGVCVDTQLDGRISKSDAPQPPETLIREDHLDGNAVKIQKDGAVGWTTSSQRNESPGSGHHLNAPLSWSEMERKTSSPSNRYPPSFASPTCAETSEMRFWQGEGFMERRHLIDRLRSKKSSRKTGVDSKAYQLRLSKSSRKLLRSLKHVPNYEVTPSSSLSNSSSSCSVTPQRRRRTRVLSRSNATLQTRKTSLEHKKPRRQPTDLSFAMAKDASPVEKLWKCKTCGHETSHPYPVVQRVLDPPADAPLSSKGLLDVASQPGSLTVPHKDHETAHPLLVSHQYFENSLAEHLSESSPLPNPSLPFGIFHGGSDEQQEEPIYEYPQLLCAKASPVTELSQPGVDFPVAKKMVTQVILKEEGGASMVHTMTEVGSTTVHSIKTSNVRPLGKEMCNAQVQVEALARAFGHCLEDQEKALVNTSSDMMQPRACQIDSTSSSGAEERKLRKATITSSCPLVQRMFQIDFLLPDEE